MENNTASARPAGSNGDDVCTKFLCPISLQRMTDPVVISSGMITGGKQTHTLGNKHPPTQSSSCCLAFPQTLWFTKPGVTFNREAIQRWFEMGHNTCPVTRRRVARDCYPNLLVRSDIVDWLHQRGRQAEVGFVVCVYQVVYTWHLGHHSASIQHT